MLIHISPRLFNRSAKHPLIEIERFSIPELSLTLKGGADITSRCPFRNKTNHVACRTIGGKAANGLLIATSQQLRSYTAITRWRLNGAPLPEHRVKYVVLDSEFGSVSNYSELWLEYEEDGAAKHARIPDVEPIPPADRDPFCEIVDDDLKFVHGHKTLKQLTIEPERFTAKAFAKHRLPDPADAIRLPEGANPRCPDSA